LVQNQNQQPYRRVADLEFQNEIWTDAKTALVKSVFWQLLAAIFVLKKAGTDFVRS